MFSMSSLSLSTFHYWRASTICCVCITILPQLHQSYVQGEKTFLESSLASYTSSSTTSNNRRNHRFQTFVPQQSHYNSFTHQQQQHLKKQRQQQVLKQTTQEEEEEATESNKEQQQPPPPKKNNSIVVSGEIELPVPATVAFDAWADLPRQPTWSPWLRNVSYISPSSSLPLSSSSSSSNDSSDIITSPSVVLLNSKWTMSYLGLKFSWNAKTTTLNRPTLITWESTSGTKNYGRVEFEQLDPERTRMKLTLTFLAPRILTKLFGKKTSTLARLVDQKLTQQALHNFRNIVIQDYATSIVQKEQETQPRQQRQEPSSKQQQQ